MVRCRVWLVHELLDFRERLYAFRRPGDISMPAVDKEVRAVTIALRSEPSAGQQGRWVEASRLNEIFKLQIAHVFQCVANQLPELSGRDFLYVERVFQVDFCHLCSTV